MDKIILVDKKKHAADLRRFLANQSDQFENVLVLEKEDLLCEPALCRDVRYIFSTWDMPVLTTQEIDSWFPAIKAIFYAAGDTRYFSAPYESRGIQIYSAIRENSLPVAEFVLAQILLANKGYFQAHEKYRRGFWRLGYLKARRLSKEKPGNHSAVVGIIGLGTVGSLVADMLRPFDLELLIHDPFVDDEKIERVNGRKVGLDELFHASDVITNHLPDAESTRGMLDDQHFSQMKPTATFINTGRGRQVNEPALVRAMRKFPSRSALLDVASHEPPWPWSPLYRTKNIFLSPHIAGSQENEVERLYRAAFQQFLAYQSSL